MPIYEYVCLNCEQSFETLVLSKDDVVCCPNCDSDRLEKVVSSPARIGSENGGGCGSHGGFT